jgi:uncharacterized repeat protein (TIGR02543 family)
MFVCFMGIERINDMKKRRLICVLLSVVLVLGVFGFASAQEAAEVNDAAMEIVGGAPVDAAGTREPEPPTAGTEKDSGGEEAEPSVPAEPLAQPSVQPAEPVAQPSVQSAEPVPEAQMENGGPPALTGEAAPAEDGLQIMPLAAGDEAALRADILNAAPGGVVEISNSLQLTNTPLTIDKNLTFRSTGGTVQLSVAGAIRHINASAGVTLTFEGVELVGNAPAAGGGIEAAGDITLNGASVRDCQAAAGGGVNAAGAVTLSNSVLSGNRASAGNGGGVNSGLTVYVSGSTVSQNTAAAGNGGGIYSAGAFTLNSGTIDGNNAGLNGGGVYSPAPNAFISGGTISGNTAQGDGGGYYGLSIFVLNGTVSGNHAVESGGGIFVETVTIENGTVSGNTAANGGGISTIGDVDFNRGFITGNTAHEDGGGIYGTLASITAGSGAVFADNSAARGYLIKEADKALYAAKIFTAHITQPFTYAYNNFDINYVGIEIEYVVTFNPQGGSAVRPALVTAGSAVEKPADPVRDGYVFTGWFKDAAATQPWDFATAVNSNITLYAGWREGPAPAVVYTVTFDSRGGSAVAAAIDIPAGSTISAPADPTRGGYTFTGWFTDEAATRKWSFESDTVNGNITLYAGWKTAAGTAADTDAPKTGDTSGLWLYTWIAVAGASLFIVALVKIKRRRKKEY